jgi:NTE family protein
VRTGIGRVFENKEITVDTLLASATLPEMFQAVKIGDDYYWDGGYSGNPALYPLFYAAETTDILIVHVNPIVRQEIPRSATAIDNRLNEITFNGALLDELRAIAFAKRLVTEGWLKDEYKGRLKNILIHAIRADEVLKDLSVASKMDTDWDFLISLRDLGRTEGKNWIDRNYDAINERDTVDIRRDYLDLDAGG